MKMKNPVFNSGGFIMFGQERGQDFFRQLQKNFNAFSLEQSSAFSRAPGIPAGGGKAWGWIIFLRFPLEAWNSLKPLRALAALSCELLFAATYRFN